MTAAAIISLVGVCLTFITVLIGVIKTMSANSKEQGKQEQKLLALEEHLATSDKRNEKQFAELYAFKDETTRRLERIEAKQDTLLDKISEIKDAILKKGE